MTEKLMGEIYLEPEEKAIKNAENIAASSKRVEKFVFTVFYVLADKEVILSELKRMGAVIVRHSDKDGAVTAKMSMEQLAAIKTLECVERVEVAQTVKQSKKALTNTETKDMLNTQQTYAATANASVSRANTNNNGVSLLCYDDGGYSGGDCSNDISTATHLPLSTWMRGGIHCPGAEMWYRFTASVSNAAEYSIYTTGDLDTVGYLYDSNGDYITENDDNDGLNFGITSELTYGATYYICVQAYGSNTGDFSLRVDYTTESDSSGDGSNDMSTAVELPLSTYVSGSLDCPGTEMWYRFTASVSNAAEYSIYTTGDLDTVGYLYDSNGDCITDNDDSGGDLNFSITSELTYSATYYVCVRAYGGNTGSYDIRVDYETLSEEPDDDGYSNDMSSAINLSLNSWQSGEICCPEAEMWYKFTPNSTAYYTVYTVGSLDTVGHIYDADCNQLDSDDDAGAGLNFKMVVRLTAGHTYYVQVAAYGDNTGCFSIAVTNTVFVEYVTIDQSYIDLDKGETVTLTATVEPSYATNKTLYWETSDSSVATVNQSGVVTARGAGTACIRVYSQDGSNKSSCCEVWVDVPVKSVTINTTSLLMRVGEQEDLNAEICPTDAVNQLIRWTSTDTSVVWVNEATGQVEARGVGRATVYATAQDGTGVRGSCAIQVEPPIAVQGIDICCDNYTMNVGETAYLSYDIYPCDATNQSVTWCSSNPSVAEVNSTTGQIVAKKAGSTIIAVSTDDGCYVDSCNVFVDFPDMFKDFASDNTVVLSDVKYTDDGFFLVTESLSSILTRNGIGYLSENVDNDDVTNVTAYYDDWYIFAIKSNSIFKYGLCKMREQENDYVEGISDFDDPGVTISFINLDEDILTKCIESATKQNTYNLLQALNKVTGPGVYAHDEDITAYFADVKSKGAYLVAEEYVNLIAQKCIDGTIPVPNNFIAILDEIDAIDKQLENVWLGNEARLALINKKNDLVRVPNWLAQINENAGYNVYNTNNRTISVANKNNLSLFEKYAILSTHTADVNFNSFAAEVEFHADAVNDWKSDIPWLGNKWYEAAIRADMAIGEEYESGFYNEYYDLDSDLVKAQAATHGEY